MVLWLMSLAFLVSSVPIGYAQTNPFGGFMKKLEGSLGDSSENKNPLSNTLSGNVDNDGDKKGETSGNKAGIFGNILEEHKNTTLGPVGSYIIGRNLAAQVAGAYRMVPVTDPRYDYVASIVNTLQLNSRVKRHYKQTVVGLIEDKTVNAFAAPGGFIFVTTGMLKAAESEDELAYVLAHEMAHLEIGHGLAAIRQAAAQKLMSNTFASIGGLNGFFNAVFSGYGKELEIEADKRGAEITAKAGYGVASGIKLLEKLQSAKSKNYPKNRAEIVSKHIKKLGLSYTSNKHVHLRTKRYNKNNN